MRRTRTVRAIRTTLFALLGLAPLGGCGSSPGDGPRGPLVEGWADAPLLEPVTYTPHRDSVVVAVPAVEGAEDYRVIVARDDTTVTASADGFELVSHATIFCAGREQHGAPVEEKPNAVMRLVEVTGVSAGTRVYVEAIDRECPFAGFHGGNHVDVPVFENVQHDFGSDATFPIRTEAEIEAEYGSLIVNGHGPGAVRARPAKPSIPRVLARAELVVTPSGTASHPLANYEDFDDPSDVFTWVGPYEDRYGGQGHHLRNSRFSFFTQGSEIALLGDEGVGQNVAFIDRGQLHTYLADWSQEIFSTAMLVPRQPVEIDAVDYLHVRFEVAINVSDRRYPWFSLCGASQKGATFDAYGNLQGRMTMAPFFYAADGLSPYVEGWNCLQVFPFQGGYYTLGPEDDKPESSMRVIVNRAHEGTVGDRDNVTAVGPVQYGSWAEDTECDWCGWFRTWDASHALTGPMFDQVLRTAPKSRVDLYIRRDRVVVYLDGEEKLCNDFPRVPLTMAEGAIGIGHVLYHTSAEQVGFTREDWLHTAQRYYRTNSPWIDVRSWDGIGWESHVGLPSGFDAATCFVSDRP